MNHDALSFEALATSNGVKYVVDDSSNTLIVNDIGHVDLYDFANLIKQYGYNKEVTKINVRVKESNAIYFFQHGFKIEASIMAFYGLQDACYLVYFIERSRSTNPLNTLHDNILEKAYQNPNIQLTDTIISNLNICTEELKLSIDANKQKFFAKINNQIVATANAFYDKKEKVVEYSDFTVDIDKNIQQILKHLLIEMNAYYQSIGCLTAYTLVPASNLAINAICVSNSFEFGGRLTNESIINGQLDSLNTWFKRL